MNIERRVKMKGLRIFQYGCGKMSVYTMKYVIDNGGTIVVIKLPQKAS